MSRKYVLATGTEAEYRLGVVNAVHGPDTERFLRAAGLAPGMRVADVGCGVGIVARWIAQQVGPNGCVVGVDVSPEQVATARTGANEAGLRIVRFVAASAYDTGLASESFDLVFCRFLLMHLERPEAALAELSRLVRPGGILACEDGDFTSPFCYPPSKAFDDCFRLYRAVGEARGQHFQIGRALYKMFVEAGFAAPEVMLAHPAFARGEPKRLPEWTLSECAPALLQAELATQEEIDAITAEMELLAKDDSVLFAMARMTQVWARK